MNLNKLRRAKAEVAELRNSQVKARTLISLAERLGRKRVNRGKEPTFVSQRFDLTPLSIPIHKGRDIPSGTVNSILNQLEDDVMFWEQLVNDK